jgi:hypothetical protein
MRAFTLIIAEIQAVCLLRKQAEQNFSFYSDCLKTIRLQLDEHQVSLEHELQELLGIEKGDWETLYMYVKI